MTPIAQKEVFRFAAAVNAIDCGPRPKPECIEQCPPYIAICERGTCQLARAPATGANRAAPRPEEAWHCFARDPKQPAQPPDIATDLFIEQRLIDGNLERNVVFVQRGRRGAARIVFRPKGDHFETEFAAGEAIVVRLLAADASHWTEIDPDPVHHSNTILENTIDAGGLTIISTETGPSGKPSPKTSEHFLPITCATLDAELAKYPAD